nr:BLUF domain-containing protein [Endozoicomonas sp. G2_1]
MKHLIYRSESEMARISLADILLTSRVNNNKFGITGFLVAHSRGFIQLIEGEETAVNQLYQNISQDLRHANVAIITTGHSKQRYFPNWDMGYAYISSQHQLMQINAISDANNASVIKTFTQLVTSEVTPLTRHG